MIFGRRVLAAILLVGVVVVAVIFAIAQTSEPESSLPQAQLSVGARAPTFLLRGRHAVVASDDYSGRTIVLAFLTQSCEHCAADLRSLGSLAPKVIGPAGAQTIYVVADRQGKPGARAMEQFARDSGVPVGLIVGSDTSGAAWRNYRVQAPGAVFVIGPGGRIAWRATDPSVAALRAAVQAAGA